MSSRIARLNLRLLGDRVADDRVEHQLGVGGELAMTRRISLVAVCRSSASESLSSSRTFLARNASTSAASRTSAAMVIDQ